MDFLATLGVALGLAMMAGLNLYLTIFLTGLAVTLGKIPDPVLAEALAGFGHPAVIAVALALFVVQFVIDKIPWVDSLWDSIHTFLKPAGGVLLALTSLGPAAGGLTHTLVIILAIAGSLLTHGVKAGTRLSINTSPEPFSNVGASIFEDLLVIGLGLLALHHPNIGFFAFLALLGLFAYLTPAVTRAIRAILWLVWKKLRVPASDHSESSRKKLPNKLPNDAEAFLLDEFGSEKYDVAWCAHCVTAKTRNNGNLTRNLFGDLIAIDQRPDQLFFLGKRSFKKFLEPISLASVKATHDSNFISESIRLEDKSTKRIATFRFHRGQESLASRLAETIQKKIKKPPKPEEKPEPQKPEEPTNLPALDPIEPMDSAKPMEPAEPAEPTEPAEEPKKDTPPPPPAPTSD